MRNIQEPREDDDFVDIDTGLEHGPVRETEKAEKTINKNLTIVIAENKQDKKLMMGKKL